MNPHACMLSRFSHVLLFATLWTVAHQSPLFMGILQARILEWVACLLQGSSQPRDQIRVSCGSCIAGGLLLFLSFFFFFFLPLSHWGGPSGSNKIF